MMTKKTSLFLIPYMVFLAVISLFPFSFYSNVVPGQDKLAHFFMYIPLGFLLSPPPSKNSTGLNFAGKFTVCLGLGFAYGGLLELLQTFTPARTASFYDAAVNFAGVTAGLSLGFLKGWIARRFAKKCY